MIDALEAEGKIKPGVTTLIEPTSGNTGIALAFVAAAKGYRLKLVMPDSMSIERRRMLAFLGAELVLTPAAQGMKGAIAMAEELNRTTPNSVIPQQFKNLANPAIHRRTTAEEIWNDTGGTIDYFVAGVGTGGTVTGTGAALKEKLSRLLVCAVESADSPLLSGGQHVRGNRIQGISPGFVPGNYDPKVVDRVMTVAYEDALATSRRLCREEGLFVGISAGANICAAIRLGEELGVGRRIVVIVPDLGERYLSHELFAGLVDTNHIIDATKD